MCVAEAGAVVAEALRKLLRKRWIISFPPQRKKNKTQFAKTEFHRISGNVLGTFRNSSPLPIFLFTFHRFLVLWILVPNLGGGFKHFLFSPLPGEIQFDKYFSNGVKLPTSKSFQGWAVKSMLKFQGYWEVWPFSEGSCFKFFIRKKVNPPMLAGVSGASAKLIWKSLAGAAPGYSNSKR